MRRSREDTAETRRHIVRAASELFREHGIAAVSIADIMSSLGLTVGGFYRHFASKEALVAESIEAASLETAGRFEPPKTAARATRGAAPFDDYLSLAHRAAKGRGCPVAALCSEMAQADAASKRAFTAALRRLLERVAAASADYGIEGRGARNDDVLSTASMLVGAVALARATDDDALAADLLRAAKKQLARNAGPRKGSRRPERS